MLERFYPDYEIGSAYDIDYQSLYEEGRRGIIFDIDNTLVPHGAPADERSRLLLTEYINWDTQPCCSPTTKSRG